jgi:hypothetical protein
MLNIAQMKIKISMQNVIKAASRDIDAESL